MAHLSQDLLAWKKITNTPNQDWLRILARDAWGFALSVHLHLTLCRDLPWSHCTDLIEELLLPGSTGCSTVQGCSGSVRAMSFPEDKRYTKPAPPDGLLDVEATLLSSEVLLP